MSSSVDSAPFEEVRLNTLSFTSHSALFINLKIQLTKNIRTLIDSGASDNFMDSRFAIDNGLALQNLQNPLRLTLFDGSTASHGIILQSTTLSVAFPCGSRHSIQFLLTLLDRSAVADLGYLWLHQCNPSIDWVSHKITFRSATKNPPPIDASRSTSRRIPPELSSSAPLASLAGSPMALPPLESALSAAAQA